MNNSEVCDSFKKIHWHDSKLRSFGVRRERDTDNVVLDLELRGMPALEPTPMTLILENASYLKIEVDLEGKAQCSDDISSASCEKESTLKQELVKSQLKYTPAALDEYYLFDIYLVPPGGRIQVFATSFKLNPK